MSDLDRSEHGRWIRTAVEQYEGPLVRYARQITGDIDCARDVVQDTFLRLCREDASQLDGHLAQWLFTVCRNRALDVQRNQRRMKTITAEQIELQESGQSSPRTVAEQHDSSQRVQQLVEGLPENQKEVVRLKFQNGLSYREISEITQLSVSNVGYLLHTAIQKIRKELNLEVS